ALDHDLKFLESSSLSGAGVEEIFLTVAKSVLSKVQRGEIDLGKSASLGVLKGNREGIVLGDQQSGSSQEGGCSC
ncbi:hypothetical protein, partial [Vibrio vulnificus]|uniref:hypothetical protein n=1 Tax=Vibrio vulnificus TaxID=672 RepID=UPI0019D429B4